MLQNSEPKSESASKTEHQTLRQLSGAGRKRPSPPEQEFLLLGFGVFTLKQHSEFLLLLAPLQGLCRSYDI